MFVLIFTFNQSQPNNQCVTINTLNKFTKEDIVQLYHMTNIISSISAFLDIHIVQELRTTDANVHTLGKYNMVHWISQ